MNGMCEKSAEASECSIEFSECPLRVLGTTPVKQWFHWMFWFLRALSERAPRKEYEHFLRDLERLISFRLNNGSWDPNQDF